MDRNSLESDNIILYCPDDGSRAGREARTLALKIASKGIRVLGTRISWPRDELLIYPDGRCLIDSRWTGRSYFEHEACSGGRFVKGLDFILCSDSLPEHKRKMTEDNLNSHVSFVYINLRPAIDSLKKVKVKEKEDFYEGYQKDPHIDVVLNLRNITRRIFTYDCPTIIEMVKPLADRFGYELVTLPFKEAGYVSVGFLQTRNLIVVDKRAVETIDLMRSIGEPVIASPEPMTNTNKWGAGMRCIYTELPFSYEYLRFYPEKISHLASGFRSFFFDLNDHELVEEKMGDIRLLYKI